MPKDMSPNKSRQIIPTQLTENRWNALADEDMDSDGMDFHHNQLLQQYNNNTVTNQLEEHKEQTTNSLTIKQINNQEHQGQHHG